MKTISIRTWQMAVVTALCAGMLAACDEIPQDKRKSFAGDAEVKLQSETFKGDKAAFEQALADRSHHSDDYAVIGGAKKE